MKKLNWGVLGTAKIARTHTIPGMQQAENCNLYAVAGRSLEKAEQYRDAFGFEKAYGSYEALLADPAVEAVYIPLPNALHCEWTIRALEAKKHVLCEKPLAPTLEEIDRMYAAAEKNGVCLMEAFAYLHSPFLAAIRDEIASGAIGELLYGDSAFIASNHDISNIRMRMETRGGALYDVGCYCTSQLLAIFDEEPLTVQAVSELTDEGVDICTTGILTFQGGKRATFQTGMVLATDSGRRVDRLYLHGTEGWIKTEEPFNVTGEPAYTVWRDGVSTVKTVKTPNNYALEVEQLGRCVCNGERPLVTEAFTKRNARVISKVLHSVGYY